MDMLNKLVLALKEEIDEVNKERLKDELGHLDQVHLKILGQSALLFNPDISKKITINQTRDLDAIIEGNWSQRGLINRAIAKLNLIYDDFSKEIWIPPGSHLILAHESHEIKLETLDPFFVLLSKAVKAPEKNKELIAQGLVIFGEDLANAIIKEGGDLEFFV